MMILDAFRVRRAIIRWLGDAYTRVDMGANPDYYSSHDVNCLVDAILKRRGGEIAPREGSSMLTEMSWRLFKDKVETQLRENGLNPDDPALPLKWIDWVLDENPNDVYVNVMRDSAGVVYEIGIGPD